MSEQESRLSYLKRVIPDLKLIQGDIEDSAQFARRKSDFALVNAITRVERLLADLKRAYAAE